MKTTEVTMQEIQEIAAEYLESWGIDTKEVSRGELLVLANNLDIYLGNSGFGPAQRFLMREKFIEMRAAFNLLKRSTEIKPDTFKELDAEMAKMDEISKKIEDILNSGK